MPTPSLPDLETKFVPLTPTNPSAAPGHVEGYAAIFGEPDRGGDIIAPGAFSESLTRRATSIKFLWQHDAARPIGIWDEVAEDKRGLRVKGRLLTGIRLGAEAATLLNAGALDGLSIGFRTLRADRAGAHRRITAIELWEISLVTFPMAESARLNAPHPDPNSDSNKALADAITDAARAFQ